MEESNLKNNLKTKDLIYAGGFAVLYMIIAMITSMIVWFVPFLAIYGFQFATGVVCAPVYYLYAMKIKKFGGIAIFSTLIGIMCVGAGHIYTLIFAIPLGFLADFICKMGKYEKKTGFFISYVIFNLLTIAPTLMFVTAKDATVQMCIEYYGEDYGDSISALITHYMVPAQTVLALLGGIVGGFLALKLMKKHFEKAGVL